MYLQHKSSPLLWRLCSAKLKEYQAIRLVFRAYQIHGFIVRISNLVRHSVSSDKKSWRRTTTTDGRTTDACLYYKLTWTPVKLKLNTNFLNHFPMTVDMFNKTWSFLPYSQDPSVKNIKVRNKSMIKILPCAPFNHNCLITQWRLTVC